MSRLKRSFNPKIKNFMDFQDDDFMGLYDQKVGGKMMALCAIIFPPTF